MIFDGRPTSQITPADLEELVAKGVQEDRHVDFKEAPHAQNDRGTHELLKDICSFANADGGYLLIGVREDGERRATSYQNIPDPEGVRRSILDRCLTRIEPRLTELDISPLVVGGCTILVCRVPESDRKPHCSLPDREHHYFWRRYEDGNKLMSAAEIRECYDGDRVFREIARLQRQIESLTVQNQRAAEAAQPVDAANVFQLQNVDRFLEFTEAEFRSVIENEPYFRLRATPIPLNHLDLQGQITQIRAVAEHPPELRQHGFDVSPDSSLQRTPLGLITSQTQYQHLRVLFNGHIEFWSYMDGLSFLLDQPIDRELPVKRISPLGFIERVENFVRLCRQLYESVGYGGEARFDVGFFNIRGFYLVPYANEARNYMSARHDVGRPYGPQPFNGTDLRAGPAMSVVGALPDQVTWNVVREVYRQFALGEEHIPYFDADHQCILEEPRPDHGAAT